jgi:hypothetical protein
MALPPHALDWLRQWQSAGPALEEVHRHELRQLTPELALAAADALLSSTPRLAEGSRRWSTSGLIDLQAWLHRGRR